MIQFYLNNTINLCHLTQRIISCYTNKMAIVSWRHFTVHPMYLMMQCSLLAEFQIVLTFFASSAVSLEPLDDLMTFSNAPDARRARRVMPVWAGSRYLDLVALVVNELSTLQVKTGRRRLPHGAFLVDSGLISWPLCSSTYARSLSRRRRICVWSWWLWRWRHMMTVERRVEIFSPTTVPECLHNNVRFRSIWQSTIQEA